MYKFQLVLVVDDPDGGPYYYGPFFTLQGAMNYAELNFGDKFHWEIEDLHYRE